MLIMDEVTDVALPFADRSMINAAGQSVEALAAEGPLTQDRVQ